MNNQSNERNKLVFIIVMVFLLLGFIVFLIGRAQNGSGDGEESLSYTSPAFMSYKSEPYLPLSSTAANGFLLDDMAYFARNTLSGYSPTDNPNVLFNLSKDPVISGSSVAFIGTYERSKDPINVSVTPLKHDRFKISITDTVTKKNIDTKLPSNSVRNQYIGALPVEGTGYSIDYLSSNDSIQITLYDSNIRTTALEALQAGLQVKSLDGVKYTILTPTSAGEGAPAL